ncbi:hypothetical protein [Spiroplasma phoeniceum]|uniref:Uncharacterized protein n=1 Tax=Spiroplasma phoeniceum P40 TaxID=1276259 RepID=A0A345DP95_9MOLU|nr:hypothetical protein [Spiroplasma phoeniceum]AXF96033.1 hypothetical protein SDAV_001053 [Spiroplasma phoeniceum P40]
MKWEPQQTIEILKEYVYSKNRLDEYRNRVALSNLQLPPFYLKEDKSQSVSSVVVRFINEKEIKKAYDKNTYQWIINSLEETILNSLKMGENIIGIHRHENIYLALYEDDGDLNYLIEIANYINTTVKIINYTLYEKYQAVREVRIGIGIANDPSIERINDLEESFIVPFDEDIKDSVQLAETYAAEVIMFNNLPVCTDAWVFMNLTDENQELIRKNSRQYFNLRTPRQRLFTDLIDPNVAGELERGTLQVEE